MKCDKCGFDNSAGSAFCQECGDKLTNEGLPVKNNTVKYRVYKQIETGIDDVMFVPKKRKGNKVFNIILVCLILVVCFLVGKIFINSSSGDSSAFQITPTPFVETFPLNQLSLKNLDSEWSGYGNNAILYIKGTLMNNYSQSAKNVEIRIDFYGKEDNEDLFDTRYITISGVSYNGAYSFNEPIYGFNSLKKFWWQLTVISAEAY